MPRDHRRQHLQELTDLRRVEAAHLTERRFGALLAAAEDVTENVLAGPAAGCAEEAAEVIEDAAVVVAVEGAGERRGAVGARGILGQGTDQDRDGSRHGLSRGRVVGTDTFTDL